MKKKIYFGILAIATTMLGAMALSSCSHDDYFYSKEKAGQILNEKYAIAFENAFGKVGPNVDWGFGQQSSTTRGFTRAGEVTFPTTITFPDYCDASKFMDAVPATGVNKLPEGCDEKLMPKLDNHLYYSWN